MAAPLTRLEAQIIRQVEYYLSDYNLYRDRYLRKLINKDPEGWVFVNDIIEFKRLKELSGGNAKVVVSAVRKSIAEMVQVSEDGEKIRRYLNRLLPPRTKDVRIEIAKRGVFVNGFPEETTMDELIEFFMQYEKVVHISMRYKYEYVDEDWANNTKKKIETEKGDSESGIGDSESEKDKKENENEKKESENDKKESENKKKKKKKTKKKKVAKKKKVRSGFKGSVFVTFKTKEQRRAFMKLENVKYHDIPLERIKRQEYHDMERKKRLDKHYEKQVKPLSDKINKIKGAILHLNGLAESGTTYKMIRTTLTTELKVPLKAIFFIKLKKDNKEGYVRMREDKVAKEVLKRLANGKECTSTTATINSQKLQIRILEGEEEAEFFNKQFDLVMARRKKKREDKAAKDSNADSSEDETDVEPEGGDNGIVPPQKKKREHEHDSPDKKPPKIQKQTDKIEKEIKDEE